MPRATEELQKDAEVEVDTIRAALESLGYLRIEEDKGTELMELIAELSAKLREAQKPNYFYEKTNWEVTHHGIDMLEDEMACEGIDMMRVGRLAALPDKFIVQLYDEENGETKYPEFDTLEEAEKALADCKALATPPQKGGLIK